ncbi:MAG TPA: hypothetical protein VFS92_03645 [Planctomycetota bacterium]|nr:hypothetical protein [Planctomycetota bacterium]
MIARSLVVAVSCLATVALGARAELDLELRNGDRLAGTLLPARERETFRFVCPEGAKVAVAVRCAESLREIGATLFDPDGLPVGGAVGRRVRLRAAAGTGAGTHRVEVVVPNDVDTGDYDLRIRWRSPRAFAAKMRLARTGLGSLRFSADAGARVDLSVAPSRGSDAAPSLVHVFSEAGAITALEPGRAGTFLVPETGTYTVVFENALPAAGDVRVRARVRPPRAGTRRLAATTAEIPAGTDIRASAVIGPGGGVLAAPPSGALPGATLTVPQGALGTDVVVVLGAVTDLTPPVPSRSTRATTGVFVGPRGVWFSAPATRPRVEVPLQPSGAPQGSLLRVYRGLGLAPVVDVPGAALDGATSRVGIPVEEGTRYQGWFVESPDVPEPKFVDFPETGGLSGDIAVGGGFLFVGDIVAPGPGGEVNAGRVRVFEKFGDSYVERSSFRSPTPGAGDVFGNQIVYRRSPLGPADDSVLVSVSRRDSPGAPDTGGIEEFVLSGGTWTFRALIASPAPVVYSAFGERLAVEGDRLVSTAVGLRLFDRTATGWSLVDTITATGESWSENYFGHHPLALLDGFLAVGVPGDSPRYGSGHQSGSVYCYAPSGGTLVPAGNVTDPNAYYRTVGFGSEVALGPEDLAVYAAHLDPKIRIYARPGLSYSGGISRPIDPAMGSRSPVLSGAFAFGGDRLFVGAYADSPGYPFAGVHQYRKVDGLWVLERSLDASAHFNPGAREQTYSGKIVVDGSSLLIPISAYHYDTRVTRTALAIFDLPTE